MHETDGNESNDRRVYYARFYTLSASVIAKKRKVVVKENNYMRYINY